MPRRDDRKQDHRSTMRVFAVWRKEFVHENKTRDNRAVELGKRYHITLLVRADRQIGDHVRSSGANVVEIECHWGVFSVFEFYLKVFFWFCREHKHQPYDLIYSFLGEEPIGWVIRTMLARNTLWLVDLWDDPELIATIKWTPKHYATKIYLWLLRRIIRKADMVVVLPFAYDKYRIPKHNLVATTNGVDLKRFNPLKYKKRSSALPVRLLYVGHVMRERGMDVLLAACDRLRYDAPGEFVLNLVGFKDELDPTWLEDEIGRRQLEETVNILGELPASEIPQQICDSDICIHPFPDKPGLREVYPIKLYEYLAMNKAVVASSLLGVRTLVTAGENGLLFDPACPDDLTGKLLSLIRDEALRRKLAVKGRASVEKYSWPLVLNQLFSEIEERVYSARKGTNE